MPPKTANKADPKVIRKLRDKDGMSWAKIGEEVGVSHSQAMLLYGQADADNAITGTEESVKKQIAKGRQQGLSWGVLMSRSGKGLQYCRNAYEEVTGNSALGDSIGKGGRSPSNGTAKKAAKPVKKAAKKAPVKKAAKKAPAKKTAAKKAAKKAPAKKAASQEAA